MWYVKFPRLVSPYLMSLDYYLSPVMVADEIIVRINGVRHVIFSTEDEGTRFWTGAQIGRRKGSHSVQGLYKMDIAVRGFVPDLVRTDGAQNFASAHNAVMRRNDSGTTSFHIRHIHADGDMNTNVKERHNGTMRELVGTCRGIKTPYTTYVAMHQIHYNFARTHTELKKTPSEAAGVVFKDTDKWRAIMHALPTTTAMWRPAGERRRAGETCRSRPDFKWCPGSAIDQAQYRSN